jgi:hypothetical protein
MSVLTGEIEETIMWEGTIAEMGALDTSTHPGLKIPDDFMTTIKASDDDPLFVTVEVEAGWSQSKRNWKPEHLRKVVDKVNKERMAGNLGHPLLDPKAYERDFPLPQVAWAAATMDGNKAVFKGYVLKRSEARELLKLGLIDGVSIFGDSKMRPVQGGYEVISFEPETIDFARKGRSGMKSRVVNLTGEHAPGRGDKVEPKDIAAISVDELRTHAPLLVREIERQAVEPVEVKVGEQTALVADLQPQVDVLAEIKKMLKLTDGENPVEKLGNLIASIEDAAAGEIKDFIKEVISKKVKSTRGQALVGRLIGEMHTEYAGRDLDDATKKEITEAVDSKIEADSDIKALVGEMKGGNDDEGETRGGAALGGRSRAGENRGRNGAENGVVRQTENLVVKSVKL